MMMMDGGDAGGLLIATQKIYNSECYLPACCLLPAWRYLHSQISDSNKII